MTSPVALQTVLTVVAGQSPIPIRKFPWGTTVRPMTVGTRGDWVIQAAGVNGVHFQLLFDGKQIHVAGMPSGGDLLLSGEAIGHDWVAVPVSSDLKFGAACIKLACEPAPTADAAIAPVAPAGTVVMPAFGAGGGEKGSDSPSAFETQLLSDYEAQKARQGQSGAPARPPAPAGEAREKAPVRGVVAVMPAPVKKLRPSQAPVQIGKDSPVAAAPPVQQTPVVSPQAQPPVASPPAQPPVASPPAQPPVASPPAQPPVASPPARPPVASPPAQPPVASPPAQPPVASPQPSPVTPPAQAPTPSPLAGVSQPKEKLTIEALQRQERPPPSQFATIGDDGALLKHALKVAEQAQARVRTEGRAEEPRFSSKASSSAATAPSRRAEAEAKKPSDHAVLASEAKAKKKSSLAVAWQETSLVKKITLALLPVAGYFGLIWEPAPEPAAPRPSTASAAKSAKPVASAPALVPSRSPASQAPSSGPPTGASAGAAEAAPPPPSASEREEARKERPSSEQSSDEASGDSGKSELTEQGRALVEKVALNAAFEGRLAAAAEQYDRLATGPNRDMYSLAARLARERAVRKP